jgi:hypothetical protein
MSLLRRLARAAGLVIGRTVQRLIDWAEGDAADWDEAPQFESPSTEPDPDPGPPAHWLATVRARAPWLLAGDRLTARPAAVRRPMVSSTRPQRQAGGGVNRPQPRVPPGTSDPRVRDVYDVYKEGDAENASGQVSKPSRPRPEGPTGDGSDSGFVAQRPASEPDPARGGKPDDRPVTEPESARPAHGGERRHRPLLTAPMSSLPDRSSVDRTAGTTRPAAPIIKPAPTPARSAESRPPVLSADWNTDPETVPTSTVPNPTRRATVPVSWFREDRRSEPPGGSSGQLTHPEEPPRPAARFLPAAWGEPTRESRVPRVNHLDEEAADADGRWPQLPDWQGQLWQMDPIQRQLQEWSRRNRLAAEQAGSSWSGPPF